MRIEDDIISCLKKTFLWSDIHISAHCSPIFKINFKKAPRNNVGNRNSGCCCCNIPPSSSLQAGSSRVLYDLLPVVSFRGWPAVAQGWLTANHFWDGKITEEEAISGFYLLPCCSPLGGRPDREWRLAFSRSEVRGLLV